jgi:ABC-type branched-subunit amino acid transport system permease subunit
MNIIKANPGRVFLLFGLLLLTVIIPGYVPVYYVQLMTSIFVYTVLTVSWATFCGPTGYVSLASAAFFGIGMYVTALLGEKAPLPLVVLFGGLASVSLAL